MGKKKLWIFNLDLYSWIKFNFSLLWSFHLELCTIDTFGFIYLIIRPFEYFNWDRWTILMIYLGSNSTLDLLISIVGGLRTLFFDYSFYQISIWIFSLELYWIKFLFGLFGSFNLERWTMWTFYTGLNSTLVYCITWIFGRFGSFNIDRWTIWIIHLRSN